MWFESEIPTNPWTICVTFAGKNGLNQEFAMSIDKIPRFDSLHRPRDLIDIKKKKTNSFYQSFFYQSMTSFGQFGSSVVIGKFGAVSMRTSVAVAAPYHYNHNNQPFFNPNTGVVYVFDLESFLTNKMDDNHLIIGNVDSNQSMSHDQTLSQIFPFGSVMTKIHLFDADLLVVAYPGASTLHFYSKGFLVFTIFWPEAIVEYGGKGVKLICDLLTVGDIDGDGVEDLIVGAPKSDEDGVPQRGIVYILSGKKLEQVFIENTKRSTGLARSSVSLIPATKFIDHIITSPEKQDGGYELFGSSIAVGKAFDQGMSNSMKSYLAITSAGLGKLYVFFADKIDTCHGSFDITQKHARLLEKSLLIATDDGWLFVGNSGQSFGGCRQCGIVYGLTVTRNDNIVLLHTVLIIKPDYTRWSRNFKRFGSVGKLTSANLFIGSPFDNDGQGSIWAISRKNINTTFYEFPDDFPKLINVSTVFTGNKSRRYTGFGQSFDAVTLYSNSQKYDYIFVGEPYYESQNLRSLTKQLAGKVTMYKYMK